MDKSQVNEVAIIFREDNFLRIDSVAFSFTIIKCGNRHRVLVSTMKKENPLLDYANFRVKVVDDALCHFQSRELTLREFLEMRAIACNWPDCVPQRLWRFMKKVFPEYSNLYAG